MATVEELEALVEELKADKTNLETQLGKVVKNKTELLNEKKRYQALEKTLQELGVETDDLETLGDRIKALVEPHEEQKDGKNKNFLDVLKKQSETQKQQMLELQTTLDTERLERLAVVELSKVNDVVSPVQLRQLLHGKLKIDDAGKLVVLENGVEVEFGSHLNSLRKNPEWQNQFRATVKAGMGTDTNGSGGSASGKKWSEMTITERAIAANDQPDLAKADLDAAGLGVFSS
jgi:hypothetical protein